MSSLSELAAQSFSMEELSQRMRDHDDPAVRVLAEKVLTALDRQDISDLAEHEES